MLELLTPAYLNFHPGEEWISDSQVTDRLTSIRLDFHIPTEPFNLTAAQRTTHYPRPELYT